MSETSITESAVVLGINADLPVVRESTTSRVILNNPLIRVVDFTFDAGQLLTEHASPRAVVVTLLDGEMDFEVNGESHLLHPGDMVYLAPDARHALTAVTPCRLQLVMVDAKAQL